MKPNILDFQDYSEINLGSLDLLSQPSTPSERMRLTAPKIHKALLRVMPKCDEIPEVQIEDLPKIATATGCTVSEIEHMIRSTDPRKPVPAGCVEQYPIQGDHPWGWATAQKTADGQAFVFLVAAQDREGDWRVWCLPIDARNEARSALDLGPRGWQTFVDQRQPFVVCRVQTAGEAKASLTQRASQVPWAHQLLVSRAIFAAKTANQLLIEANQLLCLASLGKPSAEQMVDLIDTVYAEIQTPGE